jgi:hypothetical protein
MQPLLGLLEAVVNQIGAFHHLAVVLLVEFWAVFAVVAWIFAVVALVLWIFAVVALVLWIGHCGRGKVK